MHRRLLTLTRDTRLALTLTILSGLLAGLLTIGQAWLISSTVNGVFLENQTLSQVWHWLIWLLAIISSRAFLTWVNEVSANSLAVRIKTDLRNRLFTHILNLGPAYSRGQRTGKLTTAATEGIEALDAYYSQYLPQLVITALVPISILIFIFPIDLLSAIIMLVTAPLIPFFMIIIGKGAEAVTKKQYDTLSRLSAYFLDSLQGLTTLKIFGQSKAHTKSIAKVNDQFRDTTLSVLRVTFLSALALELLATISTAMIAVEIGLRLLYAKMEFQQAFFLLILAPEFYQPLRMLGLRFHAGMSGTTAAKRIFQILDTPLQTTSEGRQTTVNGVSSIIFDKMSFTYPGESTPALRDVNLEIQIGQHIALVGESGSGKSTLINLLLGFIRPSEGNILIDGKSITEINLDDWRCHIAWVPQRPHLFHDTIAANIRLGKSDATDDEIIAAAQTAHLDEFIETLPDKYESVIGESGARLSGGQAQRLALARAFLKNAPIIILDEPTSSLDPETESLLEESTRLLMQGRTVITIAHRLNTIFNADQIVVLEEGHVVETGAHKELIAKSGAYASMVKTYATIIEDRASTLPQDVPPAQLALEAVAPLLTGNFDSPTDKQKYKILPRLLQFLEGSWNWVAISVLLATLTIGSNIALMGTSSWLIATAALHPSVAELGVAIVGVRFFGISRGIFRYLERLVSHNVTFHLLACLRIWFYEKLEPLAPARLIDYKSGDLLTRIISDVNTLENFYVRVVSPSLTAILIGLGLSLFFASFGPTLAFVIIGFFLILGLLLPFLAGILSRNPGKSTVAFRAELNSQLVDGIQGLADLIAFGRARDRAQQVASTGNMYGHAQKQLGRINGLHSAFVNFLINFGLWAVLIVAIPLVTTGNIKGVMLGALAMMTLASFEAVMPLPLAAQMWESTRASARRLFDVVDIEPEVKDSAQQSIFETHTSNTELQISNLTFTYPNQTEPALQDITFTVPAGRSIAIVGPSGAGKSTLASLLLRFWDYEIGEIRLGAESLKMYAQNEVRKRIGVVSQNSYFFNTSIRENLRLAKPSATFEDMQAAACGAQIHEFIESLPKGYDTYIGEQGLRLSGGERQRLAIARLLLKNAPILILDEPTANLDPVTERQVLGTLFATMKGRTSLLITHRLVGLENMGEIFVLDSGRVVEHGTHADLLEKGGLYWRLWRLQNRILSR